MKSFFKREDDWYQILACPFSACDSWKILISWHSLSSSLDSQREEYRDLSRMSSLSDSGGPKSGGLKHVVHDWEKVKQSPCKVGVKETWDSFLLSSLA